LTPTHQVPHAGLIGQVGRQAVLIDDILDTGATLESAREKLADAEVEEIHVMVTPITDHVDAGNVVRLSIVSVIERQLRSLA
jgi:hypoxanthine-guanine phosphoribosyltransferase